MTECDSNELLIPREGKGINFQSLEISRPVPPPLPVRRGVWENEKLLESAKRGSSVLWFDPRLCQGL